MRINEKTHPILDMLFRNKLDNIALNMNDYVYFQQDNNLEAFVNDFKSYNHYFKSNIIVPSENFIEAANKSKDKLLTLLADILKNNLDNLSINGTIILKNYVYLLYFNYNKDTEVADIVFFVWTKNGTPLGKYKIMYDQYTNNTIVESFVSKAIPPKEIPIEKQWAVESRYALLVFLFKTYADVETKELLPNTKIRYNGEKHLNETKLPIVYLDSKWFTTLVKSDAFKVSGHFRFQPYKNNGVWDKKLIYINEFEKSGYTAPARKLKAEQNI